MGYETSFKLKGELDSKFKAWVKSEFSKSEVEMYKALLRAKCMNETNKDNDNWASVYKDIQVSYKMYANVVENNWKINLQKRLDNKEEYDEYGIWFCGWRHSRDSHSTSWKDMEDVESFFVPRLFEISVCDAGSLFDVDNSKYSSKKEMIDGFIDEIEESIWEYWNDEFVSFYREHPELAVEKGDDTPCEGDDCEEKCLNIVGKLNDSISTEA